MLSFTKRTDYGLIALTALADVAEPVSARDLADRYQLSQPLLANVLKDLNGVGLLRSIRGKKGGYQLATSPAFITVGEVVQALEGPFQLAGCTGVDHGAGCDLSANCNVKWSVQRIHAAILAVLGNVTIGDLVGDARVGAGRLLMERGAPTSAFHEVPLNLEV